MSFAPMRMSMSSVREMVGPTVIQVSDTAGPFTFAVYKAVADDQDKPVGVDWGDGTFEMLTPQSNGTVRMSHQYPAGSYAVRIQDNLRSLAFNGGTAYGYSKSESFAGDSYYNQLNYVVKDITAIGSKLSTELSPGMFAYTGISGVPAGFMAPLISPVNSSARMIPSGCFMGCASLRTVSVGMMQDVRVVDSFAFADCASLENVDAFSSARVVRIGYSAFANCTSLRNLNGFSGTPLTNDVASVLFAGQSGGYLQQIDAIKAALGDSYRVQHFMEPIGRNAFYGCSALADVSGISITLGSLGVNAFSLCSSLVTVPGALVNLQGGAYSIDYPGSGVAWVRDARPAVYADSSTKWTTNSYGDPSDAYDSGSFFDNTPSPSVFRDWPVIISAQYAGCTGLTEITLSGTEYRIGTDAFYGCTNLMCVNFPNMTTSQVVEIQNTNANVASSVGTLKRYPWGLPSGCRVVCKDGTLTVA